MYPFILREYLSFFPKTLTLNFNWIIIIISYPDPCSGVVAESSPATSPCWLRWPALTPLTWPRSSYETVRTASCVRRPLRPTWVAVVPSMCHSWPRTRFPDPGLSRLWAVHVFTDHSGSAHYHCCFLLSGATLLLHHGGELETTDGARNETTSTCLNVSFKTGLLFLDTKAKDFIVFFSSWEL